MSVTCPVGHKNASGASFCSTCGAAIAARSTSDEAKQPRQGIGCAGIGCLAIIALGIVGIISIAVSGANRDSSGPDMDAAVVTCQSLVKDNLKAPSTASFPYVPSYSGRVISGEVDAENGFGAKIRSSFQCTLVDDERVRLDYLR
ncbi:hypothetical protein QWJ90_06305 [Microbacterium oryzae]|uniref:hypothetical protein n=1 Tax=Microbacterium oryzae TaxID=743009 RepID=UPI0025B03FB1|nr:hypothetical protein [Microbacterium oryzae]MDN3310536.1 hypothetical protein [Microbacterium oryzae]